MVDLGGELMKCMLEAQKRGFEIQTFVSISLSMNLNTGKDEITACIKVMIDNFTFWVIDVKRL